MATSNPNAQALIGYTFKTGWTVVREHPRSGSPTGGAYSICLDVTKDGKEFFMKALDFNAHLRKKEVDGDEVKALKLMTEQHLYECKLCDICNNGKVNNVIHVISSGSEHVESLDVIVPYLIFEKADMDAHEFLDTVDRLDFVMKLRSLRDVAKGLLQLHKLDITHQDVKPSNILMFGNQSKLGDLGRSFCESIDCPFEEEQFPGDQNYWPPEKRYKQPIKTSWEQRCLTDCYLLGSLITYYITGDTINAIIDRYMPESMLPSKFSGRWIEIEGPLKNAFQKAICEIESAIPYKRKNNHSEVIFRKRLIDDIALLCHPIYSERGFKKYSKRNSHMLYQTERAVSEMSLLVHIAESLSLKA